MLMLGKWPQPVSSWLQTKLRRSRVSVWHNGRRCISAVRSPPGKGVTVPYTRWSHASTFLAMLHLYFKTTLNQFSGTRSLVWDNEMNCAEMAAQKRDRKLVQTHPHSVAVLSRNANLASDWGETRLADCKGKERNPDIICFPLQWFHSCG